MIRSGLKRTYKFLVPPKAWRLPVGIALGMMGGLLALIFHLSNASSYLSDKPEACINCHVMVPQYATWQRGSHARVASCNDCHVPHDNALMKYFFKAKDGSRHAFMFTFHMEPQVIRVHPEGAAVIQENCIRCHANQFTAMEHDKSVSLRMGKQNQARYRMHDTERLCWSCHRETPHGRVSGLSSAPNVRQPELTPVAPDWVMHFLKEQRQLEQSAGGNAP